VKVLGARSLSFSQGIAAPRPVKSGVTGPQQPRPPPRGRIMVIERLMIIAPAGSGQPDLRLLCPYRRPGRGQFVRALVPFQGRPVMGAVLDAAGPGSAVVCTSAAPRPRYLMTEDGARTPIATEDRPGRPRPDLALRKEAIFRAGRYPTAQDPGQALP
jgi:hypothetical protein